MKKIKTIYTSKCFGFEVNEQRFKGYKMPLSSLYGSYNNKLKKYKIVIYCYETSN